MNRSKQLSSTFMIAQLLSATSANANEFFDRSLFYDTRVGFECIQPDIQTGNARRDKKIKQRGQYRLIFEETSVVPIMKEIDDSGNRINIGRGRFTVKIFDQNGSENQSMLFAIDATAKRLGDMIIIRGSTDGKVVEMNAFPGSENALEFLEEDLVLGSQYPTFFTGDVHNQVGIKLVCRNGIYPIE